MARRSVRRSKPPKPKAPILTAEQKRRRIERLKKCVRDLQAFDPQKVQKRIWRPRSVCARGGHRQSVVVGVCKEKLNALRLAALPPEWGGEKRRTAFDGTWKVTLSGNQYCAIRSISFPIVAQWDLISGRQGAEDVWHDLGTNDAKVRPPDHHQEKRAPTT